MAEDYGYDEGAEGPRNDAYTVLLILSFLVIVGGIIMVWNELSGFYQAPPWAQ